ncbi:LLM class flavin-dependent oxidoreductase [Siminovitchia sp. 179-K 8D1 HS]|uniref:LLM class flavin-dependent oxidoreductase n=1 Tax=Siminovitchia sp. 179-K 8D1 HS TaxID=3142385 RepID=UPI0039A2B4F0
MKLSILDQAPISSNQTPKEALEASLKLAQAGESLGYSRYWIAEHHDLPGLACSAPEVLLGYIGANTKKIRIGPGAVLLPHYKPYKVAEIYNTLATLFPGRVDIGIGRAPGGSAAAANALSEHFLQNVWNMPDLVKDLLAFLEGGVQTDNQYETLSASPIPEIAPAPWLLGTSQKSALLAAEFGLPYTFGHFMTDQDGQAIILQYMKRFRPRKQNSKPRVMITVSAVCAETAEKAEDIASSWLVWSLQREKGSMHHVPSIPDAKKYKPDSKEKAALEKMKKKMMIGNPDEIKHKLETLQAMYKAEEIMILTITHSPGDRIHSYRLIAEKMLK